MGFYEVVDSDNNGFFSELEIESNLKSNEQQEIWFLGSLIRNKPINSTLFNRLSILHNRITHTETNFDEKYKSNKRIASQLTQFFPSRWLLEITANLRKLNSSKLFVKSYEERVSLYLGFIELYLNFRGLTILSSTLEEINFSLGLSITKNEIRGWKIKLLRINPDVKEQWIRIRAKKHKSTILSTVLRIMNYEMSFNNCTKQEIFNIKQKAIMIARKYSSTPNAKYVKKPEVWGRAICVKAVRETIKEIRHNLFPDLSEKSIKVIENKRWQLDQLLDY